MPRVRQERLLKVYERAPPRSSFAYVPGATSPDAIRVFLETGTAPPPPSPAPSPYPLYLSRSAVETIREQGDRDAKAGKETMGLLAGSLYAWNGARYGLVRDAVTGGLEADAVSVRFAADRGHLFESLDALPYDWVLLGWWHSHPGYSCFLSGTDIDTSTRMFNSPHHRAVVIDPVARDLRSFQVVDGRAVDTPWAVYDKETTR